MQSPWHFLPPAEMGTAHAGVTCGQTHLLPRRCFIYWSVCGRLGRIFNARCNQAPRPGNRTTVHHARLACHSPRDSYRVVRAQRLPNQVIRTSGSEGANPSALLTPSGDGYRTRRSYLWPSFRQRTLFR